jgi:hypothetical protein
LIVRKSAFEQLTADERALLRQCLAFVATTPKLSDPEFSTRIGMPRNEFAAILLRWPKVDHLDAEVLMATNNALNEVCHGLTLAPAEWDTHFSHSHTEVSKLFKKWLTLCGWLDATKAQKELP